MNDLTVFIPEKTKPCIPDGPVRTIGIDPGTTNSAVAQATEEGMHADVMMVSVV